MDILRRTLDVADAAGGSSGRPGTGRGRDALRRQRPARCGPVQGTGAHRKDIGATRKARTRRTPPRFEPRLLHQRNSFGGCAAKSLRFVAGWMAICQTRAALS